MNYYKKEIKKGINLHVIDIDKFKNNLIAVFITTPLSRENITKNVLIPAVLKRGSANIKTAEDFNKILEEMYGASFNCGIDKTGDNQVLKFYLDSINNEYLPEKEDLFEKSVNTLLDIVFNPYIINNGFNEEYLDIEKDKIKQMIEGRKDNKSSYAISRCIEEMYKDKKFGLFKFGYVEDFKQIDGKNLYKYYLNLIDNCKIDIFISGKMDKNSTKIIIDNKNIQKLCSRDPYYIKTREHKEKVQKINTIIENMDISQGKLVIGMDILEDNENTRYIALLYNAILGASPMSKLFQNVREKASLAYSAGSNYIRQKSNIFIVCGIENCNFDKTVDLIKEQLEDIKNGNFTQEDIDNAKTSILSTIKFIPDEQDTQIIYYFGQELSGEKVCFEEYAKRIKAVNKKQIMDLANKIEVNTIYFLKGEEKCK